MSEEEGFVDFLLEGFPKLINQKGLKSEHAALKHAVGYVLILLRPSNYLLCC